MDTEAIKNKWIEISFGGKYISEKKLIALVKKVYKDLGASTKPANVFVFDNPIKLNEIMDGASQNKKDVLIRQIGLKGNTNEITTSILNPEKVVASLWEKLDYSETSIFERKVVTDVSVASFKPDRCFRVFAERQNAPGIRSFGRYRIGYYTLDWIARLDYLSQALKTERYNSLLELFQYCDSLIFSRSTAIVVRRYKEIKVQDDLIHCENGPAVIYHDNEEFYVLRNMLLTKQIVMEPETLTPQQIDEMSNLEIRRIMIERYGVSKYIVNSGAKVLHTDDWGTLYRKDLNRDEPIVMVKVVNSTPEPDGTYKDYFIRVPPTMQTAREAIAWTFGKSADSYKPKKET